MIAIFLFKTCCDDMLTACQERGNMPKNTEELSAVESEHKSEREKLKNLKGFKKVEYIWDYYKIPIIIVLAAVLLGGTYIHDILAQKDAVLYTTLVNLDYDDVLEEKLDARFISDYLQRDPKKEEVALGVLTYLSDSDLDHADTQYAMAMQTRLLADLNAHLIDVVLMNEKAFEGFASSGFLLELDDLLDSEDPELRNLLQKDLKKATVILSDNHSEVLLNPELEYEAVTEEQVVGIDVSDWAFFSDAGFPSSIYLGIITNSPRTEKALEYIRYLRQE